MSTSDTSTMTDGLDPDGTFEFPLPVPPGHPPVTGRARFMTARQWMKLQGDIHAMFKDENLTASEHYERIIERLSHTGGGPIVSVNGSSTFDLGDHLSPDGLFELARELSGHASVSERDKKKSESQLRGDAATTGSADRAPEERA